jgi:hypothetical protein
MKAWTRNALTFGVGSAVLTLGLNLVGNATGTGDACHRSSPLAFLGFVVFLGLTGGAGFMTTRAGETVGMATLAGLVAAMISAVGTVIAFAIIFASANVSQCITSNTTGTNSQTLLAAGGIVVALFLSLIGLGFGAGMGAIGGLIGRRQPAVGVV